LNDTNAFLATALDSDGEALGYAWSTEPIADPGANGTASVTLAGWDSAALGVSLANLPGYLNDYASATLAMNRLNHAFGAREEGDQSGVDLLAGDTMSFLYAPDFAEGLTVHTLASGVPEWLVRTDQIRSGDENTGFTFDYDQPRLTSMDAEGTPGDVTISWELSAPLPGADVQFARLQWPQAEWLVVIPPDVTSFKFPRLVSGTITEPSVPAQIPDVVATFNDTGISGYRHFKQVPLMLGDFNLGSAVANLPIYVAPSGEGETVQTIAISPNPV
jgi:hypothetical protein